MVPVDHGNLTSACACRNVSQPEPEMEARCGCNIGQKRAIRRNAIPLFSCSLVCVLVIFSEEANSSSAFQNMTYVSVEYYMPLSS